MSSRSSFRKRLLLTFALILVAVPALSATGLLPLTRGSQRAGGGGTTDDPLLVEIRDVPPRDLRAEAFELARSGAVRIEAAGADADGIRRIRFGNGLIGRILQAITEDDGQAGVWPANAWILDAATRDVVWELRSSAADRERDGYLTFDGSVRLPAGAYEAYFAFFPVHWPTESHRFDWLDGDARQAGRKLGLRIHAEGRRLDDPTRQANPADATIVSFRRPGSDADERIGFVLERAADVEVLATGELTRSRAYDHGWLIDADTRERVWELTYDGSEPAGGSRRNRTARSTLRLEPGRYAAFFVTDGSHGPGDWEGAPPYDPAAYGLTIRLRDPAMADAVRTFAYDPAPADEAIVAITGVGDDEYHSRGFTASRPVGVRIFALGESTGRELVDRGWITNATTGETVWDMEYRATEHAGGSNKNRLFDGVVRLDAGSYIVHYLTDDSHSAEEWNSSPPADRDHWGITVLPVAAESADDALLPYDPEADPSILARIAGVRNGQNVRRLFRLEQDALVRVYALGEGSGSEMYDWAWITDFGSGARVWEMRFEETGHAGGSSKNRVFDGTIRLAAGEYEVVYSTDDSHAFGDWNSSPPRDFASWGVTIYRTE